jgi:hypothetical protein
MHLGRPVGRVPPIYVEVAPPPARQEMRSPRPSPAHVWIGGYWGWQNGVQVWLGGEWVMPPQPGYRWVPARWKRHGHRWVYHPGYWKHRHGPVFVAPVVAAPAPVYAAVTISGHVVTIDGMPVPGVAVTLAGTQEGQSITDANGYYVFSGLPPGSYAVRPEAGGCAFAPDVANLANQAGDVGQDIIVTGCPGW